MIKSLAVNIVTYNGAESFIEQAIEAVKPYASEILVVDNGSTDGTYGLVRTCYPEIEIDKIGYRDEMNRSPLLNSLKNASKSEWILRIDDDEIFPKETMEEIVELDEDVISYSIPFLHYEFDTKKFIDPKAHKKNSFYVARLFKNIPEIRWVQKGDGQEVLVFNQIRISSRGNQVSLCKRTTQPFLHFGELRKGRGGRGYHFHERGHCGISIGNYQKYVPNQN